MNRRTFMKGSCALCLALGAGGLATALHSCASLPVYETEIEQSRIRIPLASMGQSDSLIVHARPMPHLIALMKEDDGGVLALFLRCTHAEYPVLKAGRGFACSAHGSRFDARGEVLRGPAQHRLERLPAEVADGMISVQVDGRFLR